MYRIKMRKMKKMSKSKKRIQKMRKMRKKMQKICEHQEGLKKKVINNKILRNKLNKYPKTNELKLKINSTPLYDIFSPLNISFI